MTNALSFLLLLAVAGAVWLARAWQASEARARAIASE
mgnify:CR=1 FL=1